MTTCSLIDELGNQWWSFDNICKFLKVPNANNYINTKDLIPLKDLNLDYTIVDRVMKKHKYINLKTLTYECI